MISQRRVSRRFVVIHVCCVGEVSDLDLVIKDPRYLYSQLLMSSVPTPDMDERWEDDPPPLVSRAKPSDPALHGCRVVDRYPSAVPMCSETIPPLFRTDERRAALCFLYQGVPTA